MENIKMQLLDLSNSEHLEFTYNILKERALKNYIEIYTDKNKTFKLPTFKEHTSYLQKNLNKKYIFFYIITFNDIPFAELYLDRNFEVGIYQCARNIRKIKKLFKQLRLNNNNVLIYDIFHKIMKKHRDTVPYVIGKINPNNKLSINGVLNLGYEKLYECYIFRNK